MFCVINTMSQEYLRSCLTCFSQKPNTLPSTYLAYPNLVRPVTIHPTWANRSFIQSIAGISWLCGAHFWAGRASWSLRVTPQHTGQMVQTLLLVFPASRAASFVLLRMKVFLLLGGGGGNSVTLAVQTFLRKFFKKYFFNKRSIFASEENGNEIRGDVYYHLKLTFHKACYLMLG